MMKYNIDCPGDGCPLKYECKRYVATIGDKRKYSKLLEIAPYKYEDSGVYCKYFTGNLEKALMFYYESFLYTKNYESSINRESL